MRVALCMGVVLAAAWLGGCGTGPRADRDTPEFQAGYSDGCSTGGARAARLPQPAQRQEEAYQKSSDYRAGWAEGYNVCGAGANPAHL